MKMNYCIKKIPDVNIKEKEILYNLMCQHYDNMDWKRYLKDFNEKDLVIIISDEQERIYGFSTLMTTEEVIKNEKITFLYCGDTIIERSKWGSWALYKGICEAIKPYVFNESCSCFLILLTKGIRTYMILPLLIKEFFPRHDKSTPEKIQDIMSAFAKKKFGDYYKRERGIVHFDIPRDRLKPELAIISKRHLKNPHIRYFLKVNPGYTVGDELICIAQLKMGNFTDAFKRFF